MSDVQEANARAPKLVALSPDEKKQRDRRNIAIALGLGVFVALVFAVTILRLGGAGPQ